MATFNLAGLPSMQVANQNAPSANVNIIPQQPKQNIGLTLLQGAGGVATAKQQYDLAQKAKAQEDQLKLFQSKFGAAYASGDRDALKALAKDYPAQFETIQKGMGLIDQDHKTQVGNAAMDLKIAASQGPQAVAAVAQQYGDTLKQLGIDPNQAVAQYQQDPNKFSQFTDLIGMHAVGPEKYYDIQDKREGRALDRDKLAETIRNNNASNAQGWANIGLRREALQNDVEMRKIAAQQVQLQRNLQAAKTQTEIEAAQQKISENKQKLADTEQVKQAGSGYALEAANIAGRLAGDPNLGNITGTLNNKLPTVRNSSQDLINDANRLYSLMTQDNLKMMKGVLTDRDVAFLGRISSGLNVTDNGIKGSEASVRNQLNQISSRLITGLKQKGYIGQDYQLGQQDPNLYGQQGAVAAPQQQMQQPAVQQAPAPAQQAQPQQQPNFSSLWGG